MWDYRTADPMLYDRLHKFSIENRSHETEAEAVLWQALRAKRQGIKFLRQHIIGPYIVDFVSRDRGLVVEVDGGYHAERTQQENDAQRTADLEEMGFHVIRFTNEEVLFDLERVLEDIRNLN